MDLDRQHQADIVAYIGSKAYVLCMLLSPDGKIKSINAFAEKTFGPGIIGQPFKKILLDFSGDFDMETMKTGWQKGYMQSVDTLDGQPRTFVFYCYPGRNDLLLLAHENSDELEMLGQALVEANRDLSNISRELNAKNRDLKRANSRILELTRKDPLTNLANRRHFDERAQETVSLAQRNKGAVSLIMTDIDHFKRVNDSFGHDAGDWVLKGYADLMQETTRNEDLVARYGGEEFIILLPFTGTPQAFNLAERIRTRLADSDFLANNYSVTASFGLAEHTPGDSIEQTIKRADDALYRAKDTGRNQVVVADTIHPPPSPERRC
ncbi:GGDEF domain-containing protein [Desulfoplanes sp.]